MAKCLCIRWTCTFIIHFIYHLGIPPAETINAGILQVEMETRDSKILKGVCVISGFFCGVNELFTLLGCYTMYIDSYRRFGTTYRSCLKPTGPDFNGPSRNVGN